MLGIERSIDTLGYQVREQEDPRKLAARVYALEVYALRDRTNSKVRFILYDLDVKWTPSGNTVPAVKIGEVCSFGAAVKALRKYLSEKMHIPLKSQNSQGSPAR